MKQKTSKKSSSDKAKSITQEQGDVFRLINSNRNLKKKISAINSIPYGHTSLSVIRESTSDPSIKKCTPFLWAVYKQEFELARCLIERGADCHTSCYMVIQGRIRNGISSFNQNTGIPGLREISSLEMITAKNAISLLSFMLEQKIVTNTNQFVNSSNQTMVHMVAKYGHCEMMDLLVEFNADINVEDSNKTRPLVLACHFGYERMVECLVRHHVSIQFSVDDLTFLSWFDLKAKEPSQTIALAITSQRIEVSPSHYGKIAKHLEVFAPSQHDILIQLFVHIERKSFKEALALLSKYTSNIDVVSAHNGRSILHLVARHVDDDDSVGYELAKAVLARKPDTNVRSEPGNTAEDAGFTPLHLACEFGHEKMMILLLCHQAKIDCITASDNTPLHLAAMQGQISIVRFLCRRYQQLGLSIDPLSKGKVTPLILSVAYRKTEVVKLLLNYGADPTRSSGLADSVILVAIDRRHGEFIPEILALLIQECVKRPVQQIDVIPNSDEATILQKQSLDTASKVLFPKGFTVSGDMVFNVCREDELDLTILTKTILKIKHSRNLFIKDFESFQRQSAIFIWTGIAPIFYAIATECLPAIEMLMQHERYRSPFTKSNNEIELAFKVSYNLKKSRSLKVVIDQLIKIHTEKPFSIPISLLVQAVALNETKIVRVLLNSGRVENLKTTDFSLMLVLLKFCNEATLRELIQFGIHFNDSRNTLPFSYLGFLVANNKFNLARCLLQQKCIDVNTITRDSTTALMQACLLKDQESSVKFINLLVEYGADPMKTHSSGLNVLHIAVILNNTQAAKALVMHQPALVTNVLIKLTNGLTTSLPHLCIMNHAIWLLKHQLLRYERTFTQLNSEGLSVRDIAIKSQQLEVIQIIEAVCVEKTKFIKTYDTETHHEHYTGRQYLLKVLGFTITDVEQLQSARKSILSDGTQSDDISNQLVAVVTPSTPTYFSGRFTLFNTTSKVRRTENIQILADWQAIGEINEDDLRSFKEVLQRPKLVITGAGVKHIGRHAMQIRLSEDALYSEYPCCYEIKITSSKARLLCIEINADSNSGPILLVACHYMQRGLHAQRDNKRLDESIKKTLRLFDTIEEDSDHHNTIA